MKKILLIIIIFTSIPFLFSDNVHPKFNINNEDFITILDDISLKSRTIINKSKYDFLNSIDIMLNNINVDLRLVDKNHRLQSDYLAEGMVNLSDYDLHTRYKTMLFVKGAINNFVKMSKDAEKSGIDLFIASTYRSYEYQSEIFTNMKNYHGEEKAATIVAYPGASQHQLGSAVDFGSITPSYANTEAGKWLLENGWKYGFTLSYPLGMEQITTYTWEPWHYRYIGPEAAIIQRKYFEDSQQLFLVFWDKYSLFFKERHIQ